MLFVNYKNMLENPGLELDRIEKFLGVSINKEEMANCVDISLYRNRA